MRTWIFNLMPILISPGLELDEKQTFSVLIHPNSIFFQVLDTFSNHMHTHEHLTTTTVVICRVPTSSNMVLWCAAWWFFEGGARLHLGLGTDSTAVSGQRVSQSAAELWQQLPRSTCTSALAQFLKGRHCASMEGQSWSIKLDAKCNEMQLTWLFQLEYLAFWQPASTTFWKLTPQEMQQRLGYAEAAPAQAPQAKPVPQPQAAQPQAVLVAQPKAKGRTHAHRHRQMCAHVYMHHLAPMNTWYERLSLSQSCMLLMDSSPRLRWKNVPFCHLLICTIWHPDFKWFSDVTGCPNCGGWYKKLEHLQHENLPQKWNSIEIAFFMMCFLRPISRGARLETQ